MESNLRLGKLFGVEIGINYSWFIIFFLLNYLVLSGLNEKHEGWPLGWRLIVMLSSSLLFFLSILAHELSHSLLAIAKGLPVHSITLFVFGGVSRIEREAMNAATEFWVGVIGPISSGVIGVLFWLIWSLVGDERSPLAEITGWLAVSNIALAVFNMIPGYPLDGGRVLRAFIWAVTRDVQKATRIAASVGRGFAYLFILGGIIAAAVSQNLSWIWIAVIGWFLLDAARSTLRAISLEHVLKGARARDLISADVPVVPAGLALPALLDQYVLNTGRRHYVVADENGRLIGMLAARDLKKIRPEHWAGTTAGQAAVPFESIGWIEPETDLFRVLQIMDSSRMSQIPVVSDNKLEGFVKRDDILRFVTTRKEFSS